MDNNNMFFEDISSDSLEGQVYTGDLEQNNKNIAEKQNKKESKLLVYNVNKKTVIGCILAVVGCVLMALKNANLPINYLILLVIGFVLCVVTLGMAIGTFIKFINSSAYKNIGSDENLQIAYKIALGWLIAVSVITLVAMILFAFLFGSNGISALFG